MSTQNFFTVKNEAFINRAYQDFKKMGKREKKKYGNSFQEYVSALILARKKSRYA